MKITLIQKVSVLAYLLISFTTQAQTTHSTTANAKATATLASVCTIATKNVNFGQVMLPISTQTATSSMNVQCTKGSAYTISLAYGGAYGLGGTPTGDYYVYRGCWVNCNPGHQNVYYELNAQGTQIGTAIATVQPSNPTNPSYSYGKMLGVSSGDNIAYSIQVPNNPSAIWNTGNSNYPSTGTGLTQSIPVVATLVPSQTTNQYPTADSYLDTVVATISY
jgi:spore coat protein U-like protein